MEITTVKIHKNTKYALDKIKRHNESYDEVITKLISEIKNKDIKNKLIAAYKSLDKKDLEVLKEWEVSSSGVE